MFTLNHKYKNDEQLERWLRDNMFASKKECLVQFFCGIPDVNIMQKISTKLENELPNAHIMGTTTDGEIIDDVVTTKAIIINVTIFEKSTITSVGVDYEGDSFDLGCEIAKRLETKDAKVMILFTTGLVINGEVFLNGIKSLSKDEYLVSGAMAGDNAKFVQTYISHQGKVIEEGAVGVVLKGSELYTKNRYQLGWHAVGLPMKVTKSQNNIVYELDEEPIISVYEKYFGKLVSKQLPRIGIEIPLLIERDGVTIARACINKLADGSLLFAGNVKEGETVRFGIGSLDAIIKDSRITWTNAEDTFIPEGIFIYSCMARRRLLNKESSVELKNYAKLCPVSGFFGNGEFFSNNEATYLLNETMTILALSESNTRAVSIQNNILEDVKEDTENCENSEMVTALVHMTNVIASEWQARIDKEIGKNEERNKINFQNNKLIQMGEMIGMIAHQWRQPLNAISAAGINLSLLSSMGKLEPQKVQQSSEFIQNQCQKMSHTIDTFINFVQPAKESKPFKLSHLLRAIMEIMEPQLINHNIKVNINVTNDNISMVGYEDLLEQVILNLLSNARDAFDGLEQADKHINITIDIAEAYGIFSTGKDKAELLGSGVPTIIIEDNAGGIAESIREKIFNPYFTTKKQGKGTGIGLYMSMDIMRQSFNGNIIYQNIEKGSRFEVYCAPVDEGSNS